MRTVSLLLALLLVSLLAQAQTTIHHEDFEGPDFERYDLRKNSCTQHFTFNSFLHNGQDYVYRGTVPPLPALWEGTVSGYAGTFIMAEDIDGAYGGGAGNICIQLHAVDISGYDDLQLSWTVSTSGDTGNPTPGDGRYEASDAIYLEYAVDGGLFYRAGRIDGGDNSSYSTNYTVHDDDGDGYCNAATETHVTGIAQTFTYDLTGITGSSLVVRVFIGGMAGAQEEVQFDDIMILGRSTLPVELTRFEAHTQGSEVVLMWETETETNNAGFVVQHRLANDVATWTVAGFVSGYGTTATPQQYRYRMANLLPGSHVFRLKQIDYDGGASFSEAVTVEVATTGAYTVSAAAPNPFETRTTFSLSVATPQDIEVTVYDLLGRRVAQLHSGPISANRTHPFTFDAQALPPGPYVYRVQGKHFATSRMVVRMQ